jgi:chromosome partitioning protein
MGTETIALLNMKGGVGKTTLAVNLAWYMFRHRKKKVLLLDLDPQFNASQYVMEFADYGKHVKNKGTIADLLIEQPTLRLTGKKPTKTVKEVLFGVERNSTARFDFLPAELALAHVVKNPAQMEHKLEKLLTAPREDFDYIFIDCAPTDSVLTTMALNASNFILTPMRPDRFSILGFTNLVATLKNFRESSPDLNKVGELGLVFTQVLGDSGVEADCIRDIRAQAKTLGSYVFDSQLGWSNTFIRAVENRTPAFETKYARDELKDNIAGIVVEMEKRISILRKAKPAI